MKIPTFLRHHLLAVIRRGAGRGTFRIGRAEERTPRGSTDAVPTPAAWCMWWITRLAACGSNQGRDGADIDIWSEHFTARSYLFTLHVGGPMTEANVKAGRIRRSTSTASRCGPRPPRLGGLLIWKAPEDDRGGLFRVDVETSWGSSRDSKQREKGSRSDKLPHRAVCALWKGKKTGCWWPLVPDLGDVDSFSPLYNFTGLYIYLPHFYMDKRLIESNIYALCIN